MLLNCEEGESEEKYFKHFVIIAIYSCIRFRCLGEGR